MLQINRLLKKYGNKTILDITNLFIEKGIIHLKGINGSGKTTFSKIVAGLIPFDGEIRLNGKFCPVRNKVQYRRLINYAESEPSYPEFLTANDLVSFVGSAKKTAHHDLQSIPEIFGIKEYFYDHVGTYSSGMLKRLSLCLAFLGHPSLILLDEPFNTLDKVATEILKNLILDYHTKGVNFVLVSHMDIGKLGVPIDSHFLVTHHSVKPE